MSRSEAGIASRPATVAALLREVAEPFASIEDAKLGPLLERIGHAKVVLLGEAPTAARAGRPDRFGSPLPTARHCWLPG